jgi:hypothetical protein
MSLVARLEATVTDAVDDDAADSRRSADDAVDSDSASSRGPPDDAVTFAFTVENDASAPADLQFRSGKLADVAVFDDGDEIWRWSDGRVFTQALRTETLDPGESLVHEMTWGDPPAGEYTAEATLEATTVSVSARTDVEVEG